MNSQESLRQAYIVTAVRTPIGKAKKGVLARTRPDDLGALVVREAVKRSNVPAEEIEDVIIGCAMTEGEQGQNVSRTVSFLADLPISCGAQTVNRFCGSSLQTINQAAAMIAVGAGDCMVAGGIESMSMVPMGGFHPEKAMNALLFEKFQGKPQAWTMIQTAQYISERYNIGKEEQDRFAYQSHVKTVQALRSGKFKDEFVIVPLREGKDKEGNTIYDYVPFEKLSPEEQKKLDEVGKQQFEEALLHKPKRLTDSLVCLDYDESARADTSVERIASLPPVSQPFNLNGEHPPVITAGNASPLNDGASCVVLASEEFVKKHNLKPLARIVSFAVAGVEPFEMGIGPSRAIPKALQRAGLSIEEIDLVEINEAFASVVLTNLKLLKQEGIEIPEEKLNVNGGAIAIGHPLGASGARIMATLVHELRRRKARYGLVSLCIGGGQGIATVVENVS